MLDYMAFCNFSLTRKFRSIQSFKIIFLKIRLTLGGVWEDKLCLRTGTGSEQNLGLFCLFKINKFYRIDS